MTAEAQALVHQLLPLQNPDGGWSYYKGTSWAEPTAFVLLAMQSVPDSTINAAVDRGTRWLLARQNRSGGWAPNLHVRECTFVTSLAALALLRLSASNAVPALEAAINWTAGQVYRDHLSFSFLLAKAFHLPPPHAPGSVPWFPGTAGWVTPTALSALTLLAAARQCNRPELRSLALTSCSYLIDRRCADNGWNHGGSKTRSEDATSYPETTGLALLALRAAALPLPAPAIDLAHRFGSHPESMEGLAWIQMALSSSTRLIPDPPQLPPARTNRDLALRLLSLRSLEGESPFLQADSGDQS